MPVHIEDDLFFKDENVTRNPDNAWFIEYLKPYYLQTIDGQYLFGNSQAGRRPDRAFYIIPEDYKLGKGQPTFNREIGLKLYDVVLRYLKTAKVIVSDGIQGEADYKTGLRIVLSVENPHTAYITWFGSLMVYPPEEGMDIHCWNYIVQERLPDSVIEEIQTFWPEFDPDEPLTLYDLTRMDEDHRRVMSLRVDYFGGAFKKPNLTMVWNRGEANGLISYHAGCTKSRVLKGLSGTGKTTLSVGPQLEQDDAILGFPEYTETNRHIDQIRLIGLEAASYAKSEGLTESSPEWAGLMKSRELKADGSRPIVLAQNIDCENIHYQAETIAGYPVKVPRLLPGKRVGHLLPTRYEQSGTTNGRFVFRFYDINPNWKSGSKKVLRTVMLSFRRFDIFPVVTCITDPVMAVALDSACESVITSAIGGKIPGTRVRSYAATDFMAREQSHQAIMKLKMYKDMGLGPAKKLVFAIVNSGYMGEYDLDGKQRPLLDEQAQSVPKIDQATGQPYLNGQGKPVYLGLGEKIKVEDTKLLVDVTENRKIQEWLAHPVFGESYLIPNPIELEEVHGLHRYRERFNPLRFYTSEEYLQFCQRDISERTVYLKDLFAGQEGEDQLQDVIHVWEKISLPSAKKIKGFYEQHFGTN
ncbi:MAG: phosphoenolpyruvate carboxykinase (ATP) [Candidatus Hermodarchaeota archaeon]